MINDLIEFYCLTYNNAIRKQSMKNRFEQLDIQCNIFENEPDSEYKQIEEHANAIKFPITKCMYGHMKNIESFYVNTNKPYGIFCEDDIYIHKDIKQLLPKFISDFETLNLDVLLLGYLFTDAIHEGMSEFKLLEKSNNLSYNYYSFTQDIWGTQMFMLSRKQAKYILDNFNVNTYMNKFIQNQDITPWSADWILTKVGNNALVYPMVAVENDDFDYSFHEGQYYLHHFTYINNFVSDTFI